ncbi:MAG: hypothetical protein C4334_11245 [Pyrinomonas sp.]
MIPANYLRETNGLLLPTTKSILDSFHSSLQAVPERLVRAAYDEGHLRFFVRDRLPLLEQNRR